MTEAETKAFNLLSAMHTEEMLMNVRLQQQIDDISGRWHRALWYWLKRKLGIIRGYRV
jgi:hypothetical protein